MKNSTKGDFWNESVNLILLYCSWLIERMDLTRGGGGILENDIVGSDCKGTYDVNETTDQ